MVDGLTDTIRYMLRTWHHFLVASQSKSLGALRRRGPLQIHVTPCKTQHGERRQGPTRGQVSQVSQVSQVGGDCQVRPSRPRGHVRPAGALLPPLVYWPMHVHMCTHVVGVSCLVGTSSTGVLACDLTQYLTESEVLLRLSFFVGVEGRRENGDLYCP